MYGTVLVNDNGTFGDVPGLESISEGICAKPLGSLAIARQGRYLFWGFTSDPSAMTEAGRRIFLNGVRYLYAQRGSLTTPYFCKPRGNLACYLEAARDIPGYQAQGMKHFRNSLHPDLLKDWEPTLDSAQAWLSANLDYLYADGESGPYQLFSVDGAAKALTTPNRDLGSLEAWIQLAQGKDAEKQGFAKACLARYVDPRLLPADGDWASWWRREKGRLVFVDTAGFRFVEDPRVLAPAPAAP